MSKQPAQKKATIGRKVTFRSAKTGIEHTGKVTAIEVKRTGEWITASLADGKAASFRRSQIV